MKRYIQYALAATALSFSLIGIANAQTSTPSSGSMKGMKGMQGTNGMHNMQGGGMMSMMMGDDPIAVCSSMMKKIAADPKLHKQMNSIMRTQMRNGHGAASPSPISKH